MDETDIMENGFISIELSIKKATLFFLLRAKRDAIAANGFFIKAFKQHCILKKVTFDKGVTKQLWMCVIQSLMGKNK